MTDKNPMVEAMKTDTFNPPKLANYGELMGFVGKWTNAPGVWGNNLMTLPAAGTDAGSPAKDPVILQTPLVETIIFKPPMAIHGGPVRNRGGRNEQFIAPIEYHQVVADPTVNHTRPNERANALVLHVENGMFMDLGTIVPNPDTDKVDYAPPCRYLRSGTIPHGNGIFLQGNATVIDGPPVFPDSVNIAPFDKDPKFTNPVDNLRKHIADQQKKGEKITKTVTFHLSSQTDGGAVSNIPFIQKFNTVPRMHCWFFIETVQRAPGQEGTFQQLQYIQQIDMQFQHLPDGLAAPFPHVNVQTMVTQDEAERLNKGKLPDVGTKTA